MKRDHIKEAMEAHTNLNVFASLVSILEGGHLYGGGNRSASRIIAICQKEQQRQLRIMDEAREKAENGGAV